MDYAVQETPKSVYEYVVRQAINQSESQKIKDAAYLMMDQLEGWCSRLKASVLIDLILTMQPQTVVEVGIYGGKSFVPMAYALKQTGSGIAYGIDPWKSDISAVGMEDINLDWWAKLDHEKIMNDFLKKVREFKLQKQISVIRATSTEAPPIYDIDLIHIDGNHCEEMAYKDVTKWAPLVRKGGIIIFDDVDWPTTAKAVQWLNENCQQVALVKDANIWGVWLKN